MSKTLYFSDLGLDFPLFKAPVSEACEYVGVRTCDICHSNSDHCFEFGDNLVLFLDCIFCKKRNSVPSHNTKEQNCHYCSASISYPIVENSKNVIICYQCVCLDRVKFYHETEYGYISIEDDGSTSVLGCIPPDRVLNCEFNVVEEKISNNNSQNSSIETNSKYIACIPENVCEKLFKTPCYDSWQGEEWQFCCKNAMVYIGKWGKNDFINAAPDGNGEKYFYTILSDKLAASYEVWNNMNTAFTPEVYVFLCDMCGKNKAHFSYS